MNPELLHNCSNVSSVDLDDDFESGTVVFVLNDAARNRLIIRLPSTALIALRDALIALSDDPFERRNRRRDGLTFDWPESFIEEDFAEILPHESAPGQYRRKKMSEGQI